MIKEINIFLFCIALSLFLFKDAVPASFVLKFDKSPILSTFNEKKIKKIE